MDLLPSPGFAAGAFRFQDITVPKAPAPPFRGAGVRADTLRSGRPDVRDTMARLIQFVADRCETYGLELVVDVLDTAAAQELWREDDAMWVAIRDDVAPVAGGQTSEQLLNAHGRLLSMVLNPDSLAALHETVAAMGPVAASPASNVSYERWLGYREGKSDLVWEFVRARIPAERVQAARKRGVGEHRLMLALNSMTMFVYLVTMNPRAYGTLARKLVKGAYAFVMRHIVACHLFRMSPGEYLERFVVEPRFRAWLQGPLSDERIRHAVLEVYRAETTADRSERSEHDAHRARVLAVNRLRETPLMRKVAELVRGNSMDSAARDDARFGELLDAYKLAVLVHAVAGWVARESRGDEELGVSLADLRRVCDELCAASPYVRSQCPKLAQKLVACVQIARDSVASSSRRGNARLHNMRCAVRFVGAVAMLLCYVKLLARLSVGVDYSRVLADFRAVKTTIQRCQADLARHVPADATGDVTARSAPCFGAFAQLVLLVRDGGKPGPRQTYASHVVAADELKDTGVDVLADLATIELRLATASADTERVELKALLGDQTCTRASEIVAETLEELRRRYGVYRTRVEALNVGAVGNVSKALAPAPDEAEESFWGTGEKLLVVRGAAATVREWTESMIDALNAFFLTGLLQTLSTALNRTGPVAALTMLPLTRGLVGAARSGDGVDVALQALRDRVAALVLLLRRGVRFNDAAMSPYRDADNKVAVAKKAQLAAAEVIAKTRAALATTEAGLIFIASLAPVAPEPPSAGAFVRPAGTAHAFMQHWNARRHEDESTYGAFENHDFETSLFSDYSEDARGGLGSPFLAG